MKCVKCGCEGLDKNFDLPCLKFNYLEGRPIVCERCIYSMLTSQVAPQWEECIKTGITDG